MNVSVTMNNIDVTSQYYNSSSGIINIPAAAVTGNITIRATGL